MLIIAAPPASTWQAYQSRSRFKNILITKGLSPPAYLFDFGISDHLRNIRNTKTEGDIKNKFQEIRYLKLKGRGSSTFFRHSNKISVKMVEAREGGPSPSNRPNSHG